MEVRILSPALSAAPFPPVPARRPGPLQPLAAAGSAVLATGMSLNGTYEPSPAEWVRTQVELYEQSGGTEGTTFRDKPVILMTSRGARSGKLRKTPLMRVEHAGIYAVVASKGGAP